MSKVGVVTDSSSVLPKELIQEYDIRVAPLNVIFGGKSYRDQVEMTTQEFWRLFRQAEKEGKGLPHTEAVMAGDFLNIFQELSESTKNILCIVLSSSLSVTYDSALKAKEAAKESIPNINIEVIDSLTAAGALGLIALEAAREAAAGKDLSRVTEVARSMIPRVHLVAALDTLYYLRRLGRAPRIASWIGDLLNIKPLIGMSGGEGTVQPWGRVRTKSRALAQLVEVVKERVGTRNSLHAIIHYSETKDEVEKLKELMTSQFDCTELYFSEFTPVMCTHTGPLVGVSFYGG